MRFDKQEFDQAEGITEICVAITLLLLLVGWLYG